MSEQEKTLIIRFIERLEAKNEKQDAIMEEMRRAQQEFREHLIKNDDELKEMKVKQDELTIKHNDHVKLFQEKYAKDLERLMEDKIAADIENNRIKEDNRKLQMGAKQGFISYAITGLLSIIVGIVVYFYSKLTQ